MHAAPLGPMRVMVEPGRQAYAGDPVNLVDPDGRQSTYSGAERVFGPTNTQRAQAASSNQTVRVDRIAQQRKRDIQEFVPRTVRTVVKEGPEALDVVSQQATVYAVGFGTIAIINGPDPSDIPVGATAATMATTATVAEGGALVPSIVDAAFYGGDPDEAFERGIILLVGVGTGNYAAKQIDALSRRVGSTLTNVERQAAETAGSSAAGAAAAGAAEQILNNDNN